MLGCALWANSYDFESKDSRQAQAWWLLSSDIREGKGKWRELMFVCATLGSGVPLVSPHSFRQWWETLVFGLNTFVPHLSLLRKDHHLFVFQPWDCEQVSQHLFKTRKTTAFLDEVHNQHSRALCPVSVLGRCSNTATVMNRMDSFLIERWDSNLGLRTQKTFYLFRVFSAFFWSLNRSCCCCCYCY